MSHRLIFWGNVRELSPDFRSYVGDPREIIVIIILIILLWENWAIDLSPPICRLSERRQLHYKWQKRLVHDIPSQ